MTTTLSRDAVQGAACSVCSPNCDKLDCCMRLSEIHGAGKGSRTPAKSLEGSCATVTPYPHYVQGIVLD